MILQYPRLKHKMLAGFFGWFVQYTQMLGIKYACSMKKMMKTKNKKLKEKNNCDK
jgi:phage pi2 protein 07